MKNKEKKRDECGTVKESRCEMKKKRFILHDSLKGR